MTVRDFPQDFLWGAATSAHQVEGHMPGSNWTAWEQAGRTVEPAGEAIDQWHRWPQDLELLASLGLQAYRLSVEWSRLEPSPGLYDDDAFAHYEALLTRMAELGLTAFVTLYHFTLPTWFPGWTDPRALAHWERFVKEVGRRLGHLIPFACTINEPGIVAVIGHLVGQHPPGTTDLAVARAVNDALLTAHCRAVAVLRHASPESKVGVCLQMPDLVVLEGGERLGETLRELFVDSHLADLGASDDPGDFVGLQYYSQLRIGPDGVVRDFPGEETSMMGWLVEPAGFVRTLHLVGALGLPVYVTENGIATQDDAQRVRYLVRHLEAMRQARSEGVDVRGYLHWSAFDNYEWAEGYGPTFGLVAVDRTTQERSPKPSAYVLQRIVETGCLPRT